MQTKGRGARYSGTQARRERRNKLLRSWGILIGVVLLAVVGFLLVRGITTGNEIRVTTLPCRADQNITVFGDSVLYYDGVAIHSVSTSGSIRWSFNVGSNAEFSVSSDHIVLWSGTQLFILDRNGNPTYNEDMPSAIQFARIGSNYCAVVIGGDTASELLVKSMDGSQVDTEIDAFSGLFLMDVGFYGENDQYMWTLALDVYSTEINTVLNTFQVSKMNNGEVDLGSYLAYKVLYEENRLRVFTTQQLHTYDYKAVADSSRTGLVFGWQLIDWSVPSGNKAANMLLATTSQLTNSMLLTELRVITDNTDRRYSLPAACVGAGIKGNTIYAISPTNLYYTAVTGSEFKEVAIPMPNGLQIGGLVGITSESKAIVTSGTGVFAVALPR